MSQNNTNQCQIRTYIRLFPSMGIDQILDNQYQILDGNTFLTKKHSLSNTSPSSSLPVSLLPKKSLQPSLQTSKYTMYSFNYIFNNQFHNLKQIQHMNVIDDCLQGKDQLIFMSITKEFIQQFLIGSSDDPGFLITLFTQLYNQLYYTKQFEPKNSKNSQPPTPTPTPLSHTQSLTLSCFSTQSSTNNFIDLLLCQKYTFYSKKDIDEHKDFYAKQIKQLKQFLIILKIVLLHYQQCCKDSDPIVFRVIVNSYDQVNGNRYQSVLLLVLAQVGSKVEMDLMRKVSFGIRCGGVGKGEDHGSLVNYLERYFNKCKFVYIYGIPFRKSVMENSTQMFEFLAELRSHKFQLSQAHPQLLLAQKAQKLNNFIFPKCRLGSRNLSHKQINQAAIIINKLCDFLTQTQTKWKNYCQIFEYILTTQNEFYEKLRFPISLQIQQFNLKSFLISKVYRLSETYKMDDLVPFMEKIRTIKNQVMISYKALCCCKQLSSFRANPHSEEFLKYYDQCLNLTQKNLKTLFGVNYRCIQASGVSLASSFKIQSILDTLVLKNLIRKLTNQLKKIKQKEQILLRSLNMNTLETLQTENTSRRQSVQKQKSGQINFFSGTKTFQLFKKNRKNKQKSDITDQNYHLSPNKSHFYQSTVPIQLERVSQLVQIQNSMSKMISVEKKTHHSHSYSISLPKIAIIHRKRTNR